MAARTTNLNLYKPVVGGDTDNWGGFLNNNAAYIDALFTKSGAAVTLHVKNQQIDGTSSYLFDSVKFDDNRKALFGTGLDLEIYHNGSNSFVGDVGTGDLYVFGQNNIYLANDASGSENYLTATKDGAVSLFYDNAAKLATASGGVNITGSLNILAEGDLRLQDASGGQYVGFDAPATVSGSYTLTLPAAVGSVNQVLSLSNTDGTLQWATPEVGDITAIVAGTGLSGTDLSGPIPTLNVDAAQSGITSLGTLSSLTISGDLTVDTTTLYVDSSDNRVGLGTTSPDSRLHLEGSATADARIKLEQTTASLSSTIQQGGSALSISAAGSQYIGFETNGTERAKIEADGTVNVGGDWLDVADGHTQIGGTDTTKLTFNNAAGAERAFLTLNGTSLEIDTDSELIFSPNNGEKARIDSSGRLGIGVATPHAKLTVKDATDISMDASASGQFAITGNGYTGAIALDGSNMNIYNNASSIGIVFGTNETARMSISSGGTVNVVGELTAGTKTFRIDHPLPSMTDTHTLSHASIEGPQADLMYRGSIDLEEGAATIDLDEAARMTSGTWAVLCRNPQVWVQNETGWTQVRGSVSGSTLTISAQDSDCTDTVSWLVVAERNDSHYTDSKSTDDDGLFRLERNKAESEENGE